MHQIQASAAERDGTRQDKQILGRNTPQVDRAYNGCLRTERKELTTAGAWHSAFLDTGTARGQQKVGAGRYPLCSVRDSVMPLTTAQTFFYLRYHWSCLDADEARSEELGRGVHRAVKPHRDAGSRGEPRHVCKVDCDKRPKSHRRHIREAAKC